MPDPAVATPTDVTPQPTPPEVVATPPEPPKPPANPLREAFKEHISDIDRFTDEQLPTLVGALMRERQQKDAELQQLRSRTTEPPKAQEPEKQWWERKPEYDPNWLTQVEVDPQSGRYVPRQGQPADVAEKLNAYQRHAQKTLRDLAEKPHDMLAPLIDRIVEKRLQNFQQSQTQLSAAGEFLTKNQHWMMEWSTGPDGTPTVQRDFNGNPRMSRAGDAFFGYVAEAEQRNGGNREEAIYSAYGRMAASGMLPAPKPQLPAAPTPTQQQEKRDQFHLQELGNRVPPPAGSPNGGLTPDQELNQLVASIPPGADPWKILAASVRPA